MNQTNLLFILLFVMSNLQAQELLSVLYKDQVEIIDFSGERKEVIPFVKKMFAEKVDVYELLQWNKKSVYRLAADSLQSPTSFSAISNAEDEYYLKQLDKRTILLLSSLGGALYSVEDTLTRTKWRIENDVSTYLGYTVYSAVSLNDCLLGSTFDTIRVWFTPEIPIPNGPFLLGDLPGLILKVEMTNWQVVRTIQAYNIKISKHDTDEIIVPDIKYDKKITFNEFCRIKKMKNKQARKASKF